MYKKCTYTGFELRQQVFANAVIVSLLAESVREIVDGRSLRLGEREFGGPQLLAQSGRAVAVQGTLATDFCHGGRGCLLGVLGVLGVLGMLEAAGDRRARARDGRGAVVEAWWCRLMCKRAYGGAWLQA
jgi:hypothetical protein